jgi:hypothetical protein
MTQPIRYGLLCLFLLCLAACTSSPIRLPAAKQNAYNVENVRLLKLAANNGILFQMSDAVLRDVPHKAMGDRCRKSTEAVWPEKIYTTLQVFEQNPAFLQKVHTIEFKRGDETKAEISKDLDGAVSLILAYSKKEVRERINSLSDIPCADGDMEMVGRDMSVTMLDWPTSAAISTALSNAADRGTVERFNFDRRFISWLADRATIYRLTPDAAFEKTPTGQPLLPNVMAILSEQLSTPGIDTAGIDYWLKEISNRSNLGSSVKFFGLKKDLQLHSGIQVDSAGKITRKLAGHADPTYPYLSYRIENNGFIVSTLAELNTCLTNLTSTYRSPLSSMGSFDMDADSFLFPGHQCTTKEQ